VSVVVGAAMPAAVCRWGLRSRCRGVGRSLGGILIIIIRSTNTRLRQLVLNMYAAQTHRRMYICMYVCMYRYRYIDIYIEIYIYISISMSG